MAERVPQQMRMDLQASAVAYAADEPVQALDGQPAPFSQPQVRQAPRTG